MEDNDSFYFDRDFTSGSELLNMSNINLSDDSKNNLFTLSNQRTNVPKLLQKR